MSIELEFWGAARTVTGSMHLLHIGGRRVLLDCGIFHGHRHESFERNSRFPFDPSTVDAVVLSHAHIDHSGNLPGLVRHGFTGPIYCTSATQSLCEVMLRDSAYIQLRDVEFVNKRHAKKHLPPVEPIYTEEDVDATIPLLRAMIYDQLFDVADGVQCQFEDAGHILGSACMSLHLRQNGTSTGLVFTGDLGRTQEIVYIMHKLSVAGTIPHMPVYVDSPLSVNVTSVFRKHPECFDDEVLAVLHSPENNDPFGFDRLTYIHSVEESKELNDHPGPFIVIAASGMCEAGRVLHHLANTVDDPRNMILIVGYQAENTLGKRLVMKEPVVNIFGEPHELRAEVVVLNSFSAHADRNELLAYLRRFPRRPLKKSFVVHGDPDQEEKFAVALQQEGFGPVCIPARGDKITLM